MTVNPWRKDGPWSRRTKGPLSQEPSPLPPEQEAARPATPNPTGSASPPLPRMKREHAAAQLAGSRQTRSRPPGPAPCSSPPRPRDPLTPAPRSGRTSGRAWTRAATGATPKFSSSYTFTPVSGLLLFLQSAHDARTRLISPSIHPSIHPSVF